MGRSSTLIGRLGLAGVIALVAGTTMLVDVGVQALESPVYADSAPFEVFCTDTLLGANIVLNDVTFSGVLSPASPSPGKSFSLENFQGQVVLPPSVAQTASSVGSVSGTWSVGVEASGVSPSSLPAEGLPFELVAPSNPSSSLSIVAPLNPVTVGPFTATSTNIALTLTPTVDVTFNFGGSVYTLTCTSYPNDVLPSGITNALPPGAPISPTIATAGQVTTPPPNPVTGPYELYCPHTPVGDLVFNDVTTSATISPGTLSAGDQFHVTGYQTDIPVPAGAVTAAVGLGNGGFVGLATSYVDAYGATSSQVPTGSMGFDIPIPNPIPSRGLPLDIPSSPTSVGPFTAIGGPITVAQDQSILVVAELSNKAFKMSCTAYPNNSIATSGSTATPPAATPIRPIIAIANASGTPIATTTTTFQPGGPGPGNQTPGAPYELYCPRTPVGDIAINDVVTTASLAPTSLNEGDTFQLTNLQTQFSIPQSVAQQLENLGLTTLSGDLSLFLNVTGTQYGGFNPGTVVSTSPASPPTTSLGVVNPGGPILVPGPYPGPYPGIDDMSFSVSLPSPVPSAGVQFTATPAPGSRQETFLAAGGPIQVFASSANLNVSVFGDRFGFFCNTLTNDSVPTGLSIREPFNGFFAPLVTTGSAKVIPPPPGTPGAYELYCPGTPVGNIALNNVNTTGSITPANPAPGEQFNLTGYQNTLTIPSSIASAAAALGNSAITGTATASVDASGATPAQISTGALSINIPLPSPIPASGVTLTLPSPAGTIGPFTASSSGITLSQDGSVQLVLTVSGSNLTLRCSVYPNNTEPSGIVISRPPGSPMSPIIATAGGGATGVGSTTTTTVGASTPSGEITQAYQTLFDFADPSVADKVAVIQNGASIEAGLSQALSSSLATSATGAKVNNISFLDSSGCTQAGLPSPCASVTYDILGQSGTAILPSNQGYAVSINGSWLVATNTVCELLGLFYQAEGKTGNPPGCPAPAPSTPTTIVATGTGPDTTGTSPSSAGVTPTTSSGSTATTDVPTTTGDASPSTSQGSAATAAVGSSTTVGVVTKANAGSSNPSTSDPITASSGSLAFTGLGGVTWWLGVVGGALMLMGFALLVLVDTPRRLVFRIAQGGPDRRSRGRASAISGQSESAPGEALWVSWPRISLPSDRQREDR